MGNLRCQYNHNQTSVCRLRVACFQPATIAQLHSQTTANCSQPGEQQFSNSSNLVDARQGVPSPIPSPTQMKMLVEMLASLLGGRQWQQQRIRAHRVYVGSGKWRQFYGRFRFQYLPPSPHHIFPHPQTTRATE